eukprot:764837-Hanusia_phi.AAC.5
MHLLPVTLTNSYPPLAKVHSNRCWQIHTPTFRVAAMAGHSVGSAAPAYQLAHGIRLALLLFMLIVPRPLPPPRRSSLLVPSSHPA